MDALQLVNLHKLMQLSEGTANVVVGLIDGPVDVDHSDLRHESIQELSSNIASTCTHTSNIACGHGTSVAGILSAKRSSVAPAICPECTLLVRPVFAENSKQPEQIPAATFVELATAIIDCIEAGAHILNISAAPEELSSIAKQELEEALDFACQRGVLVVAAAGNQGTLGASIITRHRWVIAVGACDNQGTPMGYSNLGASIALNGLSAPGTKIATLAPGGQITTLSGTSAAAPLVTGTVALLWSIFPTAQANSIRLSLVPPLTRRRKTVVPVLLNAWAAYENLNSIKSLRVS